MQKLIFGLAALALVSAVYFTCKVPGYSRPVKYVAYLGFNYLNVAKDSANSYSDSLRIVALQSYLKRINDCEEPEPYGVEYRLKTF